MKTFVGERGGDGKCRVYVEDPEDMGAPRRRLRHRKNTRSHSPTGFEWGYAGSGPAELARAIVAEVTGDDEPSPQIYQTFKARVIQSFPSKQWTLTEQAARAQIAVIVSELYTRQMRLPDEST